MLDAFELAQIQTDLVAAVCDKPCVIQRKTLTRDGAGQAVPIWNTVSPDDLLVGVTEPTAGQLQNYDYLIGDLATSTIRLPYGTNVLAQDHLLIEGKTLTVQVLLDPHSIPGLLPILASEMKQ